MGRSFAVADVAASFQDAVCDVLTAKTIDACVEHGVKRLVLGGGVAANRRLREYAEERARKAGVEPLLLEHGRDRVGVGAVEGVPRAVVALGLRQPVEADELVAPVGEPGQQHLADAAGGAGDQDPHEPKGYRPPGSRRVRAAARPARAGRPSGRPRPARPRGPPRG